jgi:hypothetical protein
MKSPPHLLRGVFYLLSLAAVCVIPFALAQRPTAKGNRPATTITVTNTNDSGPGSLRQALAMAVDGDTIQFAVTGTIGLTTGELLVDKSITISGPGADNLAINANAGSRVVRIDSGRTVTISGLTITNGNVPFGSGGGIYNDGTVLMLDNCTINANSAESGAGVYNSATAEHGSVTLLITNSTISGNSTSLTGGGVFNDGRNSGNGHVQVINSTISGNVAGTGSGGGISNISELATLTFELRNDTLSGNSADTGGSVFTGAFGGTASVEIADTILNAAAGGNIAISLGGTVTTQGYNLCSDDGGGYLTGPGDQINTDPMLGPLQGNGGPTFTHELLPGSPAINGGDPSFTPPPLYDQRGPGFDRVVNGRIDIGSFEVQVGSTPTPTPMSCSVTSSVCGGTVFVPPTDFIINVSDGADPSSVDASDLMVNNLPANSFFLSNGNTTITFHFNSSPVTQPGVQTMHIPGGAFICGGGPVQEFTCTFTYQPSTPTPTPTQPPPSPTATATSTATPTLTPKPSPTPRVAPTPRVRPTPAPRP